MKFGTIIRLLGIALGIMSATIMAASGFEIPLNQLFAETLEGVRDIVGTFVWPLEKLIVSPLVSWLRAQGIAFELYDHWKYTFVLLWLMFGSVSRTTVAIGGYWWVYMTFVWAWGLTCALLTGVLSGTVPISQPAVFWWPLDGVFLYVVGMQVWYANWAVVQKGEAWLKAFGIPSLVAFLVGVPIVTLLALDVVPFFVVSLPLALVFGLTAIMGFSFLLNPLFEPRQNGDSFWKRFADDALAQSGLDILAVLGSAAIIVYLAHLMA